MEKLNKDILNHYFAKYLDGTDLWNFSISCKNNLNKLDFQSIYLKRFGEDFINVGEENREFKYSYLATFFKNEILPEKKSLSWGSSYSKRCKYENQVEDMFNKEKIIPFEELSFENELTNIMHSSVHPKDDKHMISFSLDFDMSLNEPFSKLIYLDILLRLTKPNEIIWVMDLQHKYCLLFPHLYFYQTRKNLLVGKKFDDQNFHPWMILNGDDAVMISPKREFAITVGYSFHFTIWGEKLIRELEKTKKIQFLLKNARNVSSNGTSLWEKK